MPKIGSGTRRDIMTDNLTPRAREREGGMGGVLGRARAKEGGRKVPRADFASRRKCISSTLLMQMTNSNVERFPLLCWVYGR